jgi:S-adenosylmethionine:tRNA ribosyltransferase-isomerase
MRVSDFDFILPEELIAQEPAKPRDYCKLMVLDRKSDFHEDRFFYELTEILQKGDVLVFNDSKVIPARIRIEHNKKKC